MPFDLLSDVYCYNKKCFSVRLSIMSKQKILQENILNIGEYSLILKKNMIYLSQNTIFDKKNLFHKVRGKYEIKMSFF